jgi:hypothetical protein
MCCAEVIESTNSANLMDHTLSMPRFVSMCLQDLYLQLLGKKCGGEVSIPTLSEQSAKILAICYVPSQTVAIEKTAMTKLNNPKLSMTNIPTSLLSLSSLSNSEDTHEKTSLWKELQAPAMF